MPRADIALKWTVTPEQMGKALAKRVENIAAGVEGIVQSRAPEVQQWMKDNAPWTDRTGAARRSLTAVPGRSGDTITLTMLYNNPAVYYSVYLEYSMGGRWQILGPTIDRYVVVLMEDIKKLLGDRATMTVGRSDEPTYTGI